MLSILPQPTNEKNIGNKFCPIGDYNLKQDVRAIRQETNWLDLLTSETVNKMSYLILMHHVESC